MIRALLSPRLWLVLALAGVLAFTHIKAFQSGKAAVQAAWTAEKLAISEASRQREKALTIATTKVDYAIQQSKKRDLAAGRATADSLRSLKAALAAKPDDTPAPSGAVGTGGLERELLGSCATALAELGITADRLETKVVGLQNYARDVCVTK